MRFGNYASLKHEIQMLNSFFIYAKHFAMQIVFIRISLKLLGGMSGNFVVAFFKVIDVDLCLKCIV